MFLRLGHEHPEASYKDAQWHKVCLALPIARAADRAEDCMSFLQSVFALFSPAELMLASDVPNYEPIRRPERTIDRPLR